MVKKFHMLNQNRKLNSQWHILLKYYVFDGDAWNFIRLEIPGFHIVFKIA